jgi:hypothetical protein
MGRRQASGLTPRQREWLDHLRRASGAGESVRAYAKRKRSTNPRFRFLAA